MASVEELYSGEDVPNHPSRLTSLTPTLAENDNDVASGSATSTKIRSRRKTTHSFRSFNEKELDREEEEIKEDYEARVCARCKAHDRDIEAALECIQIVPREEDDSKLVTWDGPNDPENPMNMSGKKKWSIVFATGLMTFCISFASSVFSTTTVVTAEEFGVSEEVMILGVSLYVVGFALGPLIWGPMSEAFGRSRPLFAGMAIFCIFQIPVAVATNLETIFICRFLAGTFGAAPLAIIGGMYVDFMKPIDRGIASATYAGAVFAGPCVGPVMGSFITTSYLGWRWTAWITLIMAAFFTFIAWLVTPETQEATLLKWKAQRLRHETRDWALHSKSEEMKMDTNTLINKYLTKPIYMIVKEPILLILTLYMSLVYGILYLTFEAYPISFSLQRNWSQNLASLPFLSLFIGVVLSCASIALFSKLWYGKRLLASKTLNPEDRIPPMIAGSIVLPIGLFWFAWTSSPHISWIPQVLSGIFIGLGIILIFMSGIQYLVDVYLLNANSAIAINTFLRSLVAAGFPMFATYMYEGLGVEWATSVLAFVTLALIPFPLIFWYYGRRIRKLSKFAFALG